jgi:hypothetical protein
MPVSTNSAAVLDYLAKLNAHPRDARIQFEESTHIYTVDGDSNYMSVTTWNHHHFPKFDSKKIINQIVNSRKHKTDPEYKYYMMTAEEIEAMWNANRDGASSSGTNMHYDIECYYNQVEVTNDSIEYAYFRRFLEENPHLLPYRTEWMIYHEDLKIAGSVDMVYRNPDGTLLIYDWKRCKEIVKENAYGSTATTACVRHLPDTNFWHYALQLNTYKTIIEDKYGAKVVGLCLVCLHPDNANGTYQIIDVPFLEKEIADLFEYRRSMLKPKVGAEGPQGVKTTDSIPAGPKAAATDKPGAGATGPKVVEGPKVSSSKPPSGGPKQGYKPKGLMIDLSGL